MSKEQEIAALRAKAANYRTLGRQINDDKAAHEALALAAEMEQQARDLDKRKQGRLRAADPERAAAGPKALS